MTGKDTPSRQLCIFLCHSSGDKQQIRKLYARLREDGYAPWLDEENLVPGQDWQVEISKAVQASDVVLVCLSQHSVTKSGFVNKEIKFALDKADEKPPGTIFIIPARLEEVEVPERLKHLQWVDLFDKIGHQKLLDALRLFAPQQQPPARKWGRWGVLALLFPITVIVSANLWPEHATMKDPVRITISGNVITGAMSADENYLAYAVGEKGGRQALRVRYVGNYTKSDHTTADSADREIVSPADVAYTGITFSKDNFIYYVSHQNILGTLYRIPIFGGKSQQIATDVDSRISFSPDGKRFVFVRENQGKTSLLIHETDSSQEQELKVLEAPEHFEETPLWSSDGAYVVCEVWNDSSSGPIKFMSVRLEDRQERMINAQTRVLVSDG